MTDNINQTEGANDETPPHPPQEIFSLSIHKWMEQQHASQGLYHNDDYGQYHAYCTRRLSRLSHHNNVCKQSLVSSRRYANTRTSTTPAKGGRHTYVSRKDDTWITAKDYVPHVNLLWYLFVQAERSWAHGHELQKKQSSHHSVIQKFKKAHAWATQLVEIARDKVTPTTLLEIQAYAHWQTANLALEQLNYETASKEYASCMTLCYQLCDNEEEKADHALVQLENQDLFLTRADKVIRPLFRYCQYELKQQEQQSGTKVVMVEEPRFAGRQISKDHNAEATTTISFRGQELVLDSKELRVLLLKLQSFQTNPTGEEEDKETSFLDILGVLDGALEVVQAILRSLDVGGSASSAAAAGSSLQAKRKSALLWKGYLSSQKTQTVMDHTEGLLDGIGDHSHAERVHVYDTLLQHAKSLLVLLPDDSDAAPQQAQEEDEFALQVQANTLRFRAFKCYHMAMFYYIRQPNKHAAAMTLLDHSAKLAGQAEEEIAACDEDMPHAEDYMNDLEALRKSIASSTIAVQAATCLQLGGPGGDSSRLVTDRPLLLRLDEKDAGLVLAGQPPLPIPMHCKTVFYDLAYDHALDSSKEIDTLERFCGKQSSEPALIAEGNESAKSSSLFGWLSGSQ